MDHEYVLCWFMAFVNRRPSSGLLRHFRDQLELYKISETPTSTAEHHAHISKKPQRIKQTQPRTILEETASDVPTIRDTLDIDVHPARCAIL